MCPHVYMHVKQPHRRTCQGKVRMQNKAIVSKNAERAICMVKVLKNKEQFPAID